MNIPAQRRKQFKNNNVSNLFSTWAFYFFIIITTITLSPYNFDFATKGVFTWRINTFDMFANLFLLFPIGFFFTLSSDKVKPIDIVKYTAIGFIFSLFIEFSQLFLKSRSSQYWDIIANTISIILGSFTAICLKPLTNKLSITKSSIAMLISTLFLLSILLIIRLMMNNQSFGFFELSLLLCSSGLLVLILSHYSLKNNSLSPSISALISITFVFVSLFPLLFTNTPLFLILSLLSGLLVPACVFVMSITDNISNSTKKMIIFIIIYPPIIVFSGIAITNLMATSTGFSILLLDRLYGVNEGRGVGGVMVQAFLLLTITVQLLNYILLSKKKYN